MEQISGCGDSAGSQLIIVFRNCGGLLAGEVSHWRHPQHGRSNSGSGFSLAINERIHVLACACLTWPVACNQHVQPLSRLQILTGLACEFNYGMTWPQSHWYCAGPKPTDLGMTSSLQFGQVLAGKPQIGLTHTQSTAALPNIATLFI